MTIVRFLASAVEILGMKTAEEAGSCRSGDMSSRCRCRVGVGVIVVAVVVGAAGELPAADAESSGFFTFPLLRVDIFLIVGGLTLGWPWEFLLD